MPAGGCGAAIACAPTQVKDVKHVDPIELLPLVKKLATQADASVKFLGINATHTQRDGSTDLTNNRGILYSFATSKNDWVSVYVQEKLISVVRADATTNSTKDVPDPHCSAKQVVDAAIKGGFKFQSTATLYYAHDLAEDEPRWTVYDAAGSTAYVDAKTCK